MSPAGDTETVRRPAVRRLRVAIGAVLAVLSTLVASVPALGGLESGGDSGPVAAFGCVLPAALSAGLMFVFAAHGPRVARPVIAVLAATLGLAGWTAALIAAFQAQSSYTGPSADADTAAGWFVLGALGALTAVASSAMLPHRARRAGWAVGSALVAALWAVLAIARFLNNDTGVAF